MGRIVADGEATGSPGRLAPALVASAVLCLVAAGGLLWWQGGEAVFASLVTATLAWCF